MAQATLQELFSYTDWAREKLHGLVASLSDAQLDRPFEMGLGSIRNTLHHIWAAERVWLERWSKGGVPKFIQPEVGLSVTTLQARARATAEERDEFLDMQDDADLARPLTFTNSKGETYSLPLVGQMVHVCNHGIHHRAQIVNMLRHVGGTVPTPGLDYIFYRLEQPAAPRLEPAMIRSYQRYADWATRTVLSAAMNLDDAKLDRPFEMGLGTLRKTLCHLWDAERWWYGNWTGRASAFPKSDEKISLSDLSEQLEQAWALRDEWFSTLTEADLVQWQTVRPRPDLTLKVAMGVSFVQLCGHSTHHRAQALNMLRHLGVTPPGLDYILWLRDR
jgi:uncharacterized damage-inducible protein DinB